MNSVDVNKEEGELSDDEVQLVSVSKCSSGSLKTAPPRHENPNSTQFNDSRVPDRPRGFNRIRCTNKSLALDGGRRGRPGKRGYGLSEGMVRARERLKSYQRQTSIPQLMAINTTLGGKYSSGSAIVQPLSTTNNIVVASIPLPRSSPLISAPPPLTALSVQRSQIPYLGKLKAKKPCRRTGFQKSQSALHESYANSQSSDLDEIEYVDMLLAYKEIRKKLEVINQEEGRLVEEKEKNKENHLDVEESNCKSKELKTGVSPEFNDELTVKLVDEEVDLDELELRRKCLESCRRRLSSGQRNKSPIRRRQSFQSRRLTGSGLRSWRPRPLSPVRNQGQPWPLKQRDRKRPREKSPDETERSLERSFVDWRTNRLLLNCEEEFKKFVQLRAPMPDLSDGIRKKKQTALVAGDNYDEVEMDLDSNTEEDNMTTGRATMGFFQKLSENGAAKNWTKQTEMPGLDGIFSDWTGISIVHPVVPLAPLSNSTAIYPPDLPSASAAAGASLMSLESKMLHRSGVEMAPQDAGYSLCPLRPAAPPSYQPIGFAWAEANSDSTQVPRTSDVLLAPTANLLGPNARGLSGGEASVCGWSSWNASAIGSSVAEPLGSLLKTEEAICGQLDENETMPLVNCEGFSGSSVGPDDESTETEEAHLRQMLLMEMADKRDKKEKRSTSAQDSQKPAVMPLMKVPVNPTSKLLSSITAQSAMSSKSSAWPSLSQPSLAQPLLPSPAPPLLTNVHQNTSVVLVPTPSILTLTSVTRTVSGFSLSSLADDNSRPVAVPSPSYPKLAASPLLPLRSDMGSLKVTFKAPLKKSATRVPLPQHKPVVISLNGDTDSDSDEEYCGTDGPSSLPGLSISLLGNLDSFLKEVRQTTQGVKKSEAKSVVTESEFNEERKDEHDSNQLSNIVPLADKMLRKTNTPEEETLLLQKEPSLVKEEPPLVKDRVGDVEKVLLLSATEAVPVMTTTSVQVTGGVAARQLPDSMGLDAWRNDGRKVERKLLMRKLAQLRAEFKSESDQLNQDEQQLANAELEMIRKKGQYRQALIRVEKLREQLSATEKIVTHNQQQVVVLSRKTQDLRSLTGKRKKKLQTLAKEMSVAKRRLNGRDSLSKTGSALTEVAGQTTVTLSGDRLMSVGRTTTDARNAAVSSSGKLTNPAAQSQSLNSIASEKKYLVELAKQLEQMIEISKQRQAAKAAAKLQLALTKGRAKALKTVGKRVEHVATEEKMVFGKVSSEGHKEVVDFVPRRRRSLLDESPTTTKPVLDKRAARAAFEDLAADEKTSDCCPDGQLVAGDGEEKSEVVGSDMLTRFAAIQLITDGRLRQIRNVLNEHLNKQSADDGVTGVQEVTDPFLRFQPPVEKVVNVTDLPKKPANQNLATCASFKPYHSQLLCFQSYRFSPYYRTKEGRTIQSSIHKIDPNLPLCHFDLMGKCNDDKCPWQHERDYKASHHDTLTDIVSYAPEVAGISSSTPVGDFSKMFGQYVDDFVRQHSMLTLPQQALLLLMETYKHTKLTAPQSVLTEPRQWKLGPAIKAADVFNDEKEKLFASAKVQTRTDVVNEDDIILDQDVRYWMLETQEAENMETAVADDPTNVQLWLKLAYKKMSDTKRAKPDETLTQGLHVLSRALESNQTSEMLWRHYLHLFGKRDDAAELMNLYRMAVNFAPSYYLYWKYLELSKSYSEKMGVCKIIRQFLCSPRCREEPVRRSHHLLEIVLYQAGLAFETGRLKSGREVIESVVKSRASVIWLNMVWTDRIIVWLAYIHLLAFRRFPMSLYDPANSFPGRIVNKVPFMMPWTADQKPRIAPDYLMKHVDEALQSCGSSIHESVANGVWLCQLYRIKVFLEEESNGVEAAKSICHQTLENCPQFEDLWIILLDLVSSRMPRDKDAIHAVVCKALKHNPISVKIYLASISIYIAQGDCEKALEFAEQCALSLFDVDAFHPAADPNLLFCKLLDQTLPCTYQAPPLVECVTEDWLSCHQADIWLCFCLLLDLQGAHEQASEAYQNAISTIKSGSDLATFCLRFLRRCYGSLRGDVPWSNSSCKLFQPAQRCSEFEGHVSQVLSVLPSKLPLPEDPDQMWISYASHNRIIDFYIKCLSNDDCVLKSFEKFVTLMPTNVVLVKRACDFLMKRRYVALCNGFCTAALCEKPKAATLWTVKLLISHVDGNVNQMRRVFRMATSSLPYSQKLWKDFMLFEIAQKNSESVQWIVEKCRELQINIEDALNAVIPSRN